MGNSRKHHFVQRAHLAMFADDSEQVVVLSKDGRRFRTSISNIFAQRDLYSFENNGAISTIFEDAISVLEDGVFPVLKKICNRLSIQDEDQELIAAYMACSLLRNPGFQNHVHEFYKMQLRGRVDLLEKLGRLPAYPKEFGGSTLTELIDSGKIEIEINNSKYLDIFKKCFADLINVLMTFQYSIVHVPNGNLIIGDHPLTFFHPGQEFFEIGPPLGGASCELMFPLSKEVILIGQWRKAIIDFDPSLVAAQSNLRQAMFSSMFVAGNDEFPEIPSYLERYRELSFSYNVSVIPHEAGFHTVMRRGLFPSSKRQKVWADIVPFSELCAGNSSRS